MNARTRKRPRPPAPATDRGARLAAALRAAAEAEDDPRLRALVMKLLDGDERDRQA